MDLVETPDIESSNADYARRFEGEIGKYLLTLQSNAIVELLFENENDEIKSLLDVGGAHCQVVPVLLGRIARLEILGSDTLSEQYAKECIPQGGYRYQKGNLLAMPYEQDAFDSVLSIRMLPHLENWKQFIKELCRVSRNTVVLEYPDKQSVNILSEIFFPIKRRFEGNTRRYRCYSQKEIREEFSKHGFNLVDSRKECVAPLVLHRIVSNRTFSEYLERFFNRLGITRYLGSPVILKFERKRPDPE